MNTNLIPCLAATALLACATFSHGQGTASKPAEPAQPLPPVQPLFDTPMRDPHICLGPDGTYYLTRKQPQHSFIGAKSHHLTHDMKTTC